MSDIKVNAAEWNQLNQDIRSQITTVMKDHGFLTGAERIVGDESAANAAETVRKASTHLQASARRVKAADAESASPQLLGIDLCKIGCDLAEAAAVAACNLIPPPGNAVCIAAAHAGGEFCRSKC